MGTISEKLTYLNGTKQLLKDKINNLGGSIDDNTTFRQYANQLQNVYDNLPKTEYQEGTEINLGVTSKGKLDYENGVVGKGQTEQDGTPTPSTPIAINSVTGNQEEVVSGKNLFDDSNHKNKDVPSSAGFYINNAPFNLSGGTYRFGVFVDNQLITTPALMALSFKSGGTTILEKNAPNQDITITDEQASIIDRVSLYFNGTFVSTYSGKKITGVMITTSEITTYEPYITPTSYQLSLGDIQLNAIGNYKDELVYDVDEDKVYKNEKIEKRLAVITGGNLESHGFRASTDGAEVAPISAYPELLCNFFERASDYSQSVNADWLNPNKLGINVSGGILCNISNFSTLVEYTDFFSNNDVYIYYPKATPTEIPITDTTLINQVKALYNAHSNNGTTIITSNGDLPLVLKVRGLKGE